MDGQLIDGFYHNTLSTDAPREEKKNLMVARDLSAEGRNSKLNIYFIHFCEVQYVLAHCSYFPHRNT